MTTNLWPFPRRTPPTSAPTTPPTPPWTVPSTPTPPWSAPSSPRTSSPLHVVHCVGFVARNRRRASLLQVCATDHHGMCASAKASDYDERSDDVDRQIRPTAGPLSASAGLRVVLYIVVRTAARVVALHKHRHRHTREVIEPCPPGRQLLQIHDACSGSVVLPPDACPRSQICTTAATLAVCSMARVAVLHAPLRLIVVVARRAASSSVPHHGAHGATSHHSTRRSAPLRVAHSAMPR
ncbi:hypothetical protein GUJ93_ZPchr0003g17054 [Zizania palustris]|uniref:Uncharacterized protein n=1 Tax=Zizania palustris TaxID=103762 RepID=A0A8J5VWS3_ZIZPA|nr:hypothetical protein GUJ93_ZPchr0003g17054 [Zizania palustris]